MKRLLLTAGLHRRRRASARGQVRSNVCNQPKFQKQAGDAEKAVTALTDRERQIVHLVCEGLSNKEIGRRLNITDGTIKVHLHHIFNKLEVCNRTALVVFYLSPGSHGSRGQGREEQPLSDSEFAAGESYSRDTGV